MNALTDLPEAPPPAPGWEVPPANPVPETPVIDPVNVPTPGSDLIFPGSGEPLGIPSPPGQDIPGVPARPGLL